jgi:hypothetical protein
MTSLSEKQTGVLKGMSLALLISGATLFFSMKLLGPKFIVMSLGGRFAFCALAMLFPVLTLGLLHAERREPSFSWLGGRQPFYATKANFGQQEGQVRSQCGW